MIPRYKILIMAGKNGVIILKSDQCETCQNNQVHPTRKRTRISKNSIIIPPSNPICSMMINRLWRGNCGKYIPDADVNYEGIVFRGAGRCWCFNAWIDGILRAEWKWILARGLKPARDPSGSEEMTSEQCASCKFNKSTRKKTIIKRDGSVVLPGRPACIWKINPFFSGTCKQHIEDVEEAWKLVFSFFLAWSLLDTWWAPLEFLTRESWYSSVCLWSGSSCEKVMSKKDARNG